MLKLVLKINGLCSKGGVLYRKYDSRSYKLNSYGFIIWLSVCSLTLNQEKIRNLFFSLIGHFLSYCLRSVGFVNLLSFMLFQWSACFFASWYSFNACWHCLCNHLIFVLMTNKTAFFCITSSLLTWLCLKHHMEETLFNSLHICWQNLKMKINHPRFLDIADQEVMNLEFPTYLKKQAISSRSCTTLDASKTAKTVFMFPEVDALHLCASMFY